MKPARRCGAPGCGVLLASGDRCPAHPVEAGRVTAKPRIRGRHLQRLRAALFAESPLCVRCKARGRVTVATIRDHIVPMAEGGTDDPSNVQALCDDCSNEKSKAEAMRGQRRSRAEV